MPHSTVTLTVGHGIAASNKGISYRLTRDGVQTTNVCSLKEADEGKPVYLLLQKVEGVLPKHQADTEAVMNEGTENMGIWRPKSKPIVYKKLAVLKTYNSPKDKREVSAVWSANYA